MTDVRLRRLIAIEAAKLMYDGDESEYFTAKRKVARRHGVNVRHQPDDLPSNKEIREQILCLAETLEGDGRLERLGRLRTRALELLQLLERFRPKLIGSVCTGHIRRGSDIDLHVFSDSLSAITETLDHAQLEHEVEEKRIIKFGEERRFIHVHLLGEEDPVELTVYRWEQRDYPFKSSITGDTIESARAPELADLLRTEHPDDWDRLERGDAVDRDVRRLELERLVGALAGVQGGKHHPEGDQLYHSLQVFDRMRRAAPWDMELAEAALLHDVGKAIDRKHHAEVGAAALGLLVSDRVRWLVAHHMQALALKQGKLGRRAADRLRASPWYDDLLLLRECDDRGREVGVAVPSLDEALDELEVDDWELDDDEAC